MSWNHKLFCNSTNKNQIFLQYWFEFHGVAYFSVLKQEYDGLKASPRNMANRNSFWSVAKRENSGLRVTRAEKMGMHVARKDLLDAIATFFTQKQVENNVDLRLRRDDSNGKYADPSSYHMLRVRKFYPNVNRVMDSRMRRDDPNKKYTAPSSVHMLRVRNAYPNINQALGFRVTRGEKRELPDVYGRI